MSYNYSKKVRKKMKGVDWEKAPKISIPYLKIFLRILKEALKKPLGLAKTLFDKTLLGLKKSFTYLLSFVKKNMKVLPKFILEIVKKILTDKKIDFGFLKDRAIDIAMNLDKEDLIKAVEIVKDLDLAKLEDAEKRSEGIKQLKNYLIDIGKGLKDRSVNMLLELAVNIFKGK